MFNRIDINITPLSDQVVTLYEVMGKIGSSFSDMWHFFHQSILFFVPFQALLPTKPDYPLADSFPEEIIKDCKLSSLQLEGILYAV